MDTPANKKLFTPSIQMTPFMGTPFHFCSPFLNLDTPIQPTPRRKMMLKALLRPEAAGASPSPVLEPACVNYPETPRKASTYLWELRGIRKEINDPEDGPCAIVDWEHSDVPERHFKRSRHAMKMLEKWDQQKKKKLQIRDISYNIVSDNREAKLRRSDRIAANNNGDSDEIYCAMEGSDQKPTFKKLSDVLKLKGSYHRYHMWEILEARMIQHITNPDDDMEEL
ncbi:hypothetical protein QR680_006059 [Steinernema hermaphroditum]|uniref:Uncharacterized protein n=1 Tax=Steinernema hermaphroditum TaxID=289476 RepID=A0AA39HU82_9BILA|nr:hypothetical protein QR680_006059 [Steinernema hermaphroditum]